MLVWSIGNAPWIITLIYLNIHDDLEQLEELFNTLEGKLRAGWKVLGEATVSFAKSQLSD